MIDRDVFYARKETCAQCEFWKGVCLKGHALQSPTGCPIKKFEPIEGASFHPDREVPKITAASGDCCSGHAVEGDTMKPLSWGEVFQSLVASMKKWKAAGTPIASDALYFQRIQVCRKCNHYRWFQCRLCHCLAPVKAKLLTERCPAGFWE